MAIDGMGMELPSQILPDAPYLHGSIAGARARLSPRRIFLAMFPAEPVTADDGSTHVDPPACGWRMGEGEVAEDGPLSTMSFVALWNGSIAAVDGIPLEMTIESPGWLMGMPFVHVHPSGFLMAVSYDHGSGTFVRGILYPA